MPFIMRPAALRQRLTDGDDERGGGERGQAGRVSVLAVSNGDSLTRESAPNVGHSETGLALAAPSVELCT